MQKKGTAGIVLAIRNGTDQTVSSVLNFIAILPTAIHQLLVVLLLLVMEKLS